MRFLISFLAILLLLAAHGGARAELPQDAIGQIKSVDSGASIRRNGGSTDAEAGGPVYEGDVIVTDLTGSIGITLKDGTVLSLGSDSEMELDRFIFEPQEKKLGFAAKFLSGTATYLSGRIAKLAPEQVNLSTRFSTIGIRGTRVLIKVAK